MMLQLREIEGVDGFALMCVRMRSGFNKLAGECIKVDSQHGVSQQLPIYGKHYYYVTLDIRIQNTRAELPFRAASERGP